MFSTPINLADVTIPNFMPPNQFNGDPSQDPKPGYLTFSILAIPKEFSEEPVQFNPNNAHPVMHTIREALAYNIQGDTNNLF